MHFPEESLQERLQCNVVTFGAIIGACEKGSQWRQSLRLLGRLQRRHQRVRQGRPMAAGATAVGACGGDSRLGLRKCLCFGDDQFGVGYAQNQSDYTITSTLHTLGEQLSVLSSTVAADTLEFLEGF